MYHPHIVLLFTLEHFQGHVVCWNIFRQDSFLPFFLLSFSLSLPDVLCVLTDVIWRQKTVFAQPCSVGHLGKVFRVFLSRLVVHGAMGYGQKNFQLVWQCHQLLSGFLAKGHLPRVSRQSRRSLMIRVIMKWSWGLCTDLLAFALQLRKTPENLS